MTASRYNPWLHAIAVLTAVATLLLIFMGGLVTSHGAGMSVPDWPNTYGYNMFTFPPSKWIGGIFFEHTHRLMGTVVGMLSIVLTILAWKYEQRSWVRWLAASVLGAVILQGVLGGLRVVLVKLDLAIIHACVAQACICLMALVAVVTSRWWLNITPEATPRGSRLVWLAGACTAVIYLQLIVGALMRHHEAGLAIPDLPLSYGSVLPPMDGAALARANDMRIGMQLGPVTLAQVWLHFGHRIGAVLVSALIIAAAVIALRRKMDFGIRAPAMGMVILLIAQVTLGVFTVLLRKPADVASLHVAVGALTLVTAFVLWIRSLRLYRPAHFAASDSPQGVLVPA